jgi:subtilisin family serine protease
VGRVARSLASLVLTTVIAFALAAPAAAYTGSWSDQLADAAGAGALAGNGRGVTVAVLDTWVDVTHPDFGGRVEQGVTCVQGSCEAGAAQPDTCEAHGTHVTGIVASSRYGVAPEAKVLPIRVLTSVSGSCAANAGDVALGIRYAIAHHIKLINVSLGSTFPLEDPQRVLPAAVSAARKAGDLVIVAAGNGQAAAATTYGPDALTVAALGPDGAIASYSQRGAGVDIAAPGGDASNGGCTPANCVVSTWQDGGYASDAGTSMAAPFVSGAAALLLSQDPRRTSAQVRQILLSTARPLAQAGAGRLDILAAVKLRAPSSSESLTTSAAPTAGGASQIITPVPGAGAAIRASRSAAPPVSSSGAPASDKPTFGPLQLLGIVVVGGVGIAFVAVTGQRARRG